METGYQSKKKKKFTISHTKQTGKFYKLRKENEKTKTNLDEGNTKH